MIRFGRGVGATLVASALLLAMMPGCATIVRGRTQFVHIDSTPSGAQVSVQPGNLAATTPGDIALSRKLSYVATIQKDGYAPASVRLKSGVSWWLLGNVVWLHPAAWVIGVFWDIGTGAGYTLTPQTVQVSLTPQAAGKIAAGH